MNKVDIYETMKAFYTSATFFMLFMIFVQSDITYAIISMWGFIFCMDYTLSISERLDELKYMEEHGTNGIA